MMFCDCGSIMMPKKENNKTIMVCANGHKKEIEGDLKFKEKAKKEEKKIEIIEKDYETRPLINANCPKCKHNKAYFWEIQTRSSDEPATRFYKCEKCKHTWREYS